MATFNLTKSTTVATLKELFNAEFGAKLHIYSGRSQADDSATLGELGLTNEGNFECRASLTVGSFIERMQSEHGLKVKVYTCDDWVAVLDGLTLESAGKVKKNAVKADMESMIAYQRTDNAVETAVADIKKSATYGDYTINIASNNSVTVLKGGVACDNAKGALREVAALVGFEVDAAWTTQQLGSKLVDVINNGETASNVEAAKAAEEAKARAATEIAAAKAEAERMRAELEAANKAKAEAEAAKAAAESTSIVAPEFLVDVILKSYGQAKLQVVKVVKDVAGLSLGDAKALVDGAPKAIKEGISKEEAESIKSSLDEAGADVVIVKAEAAKAEIERIKAEAEAMRLAAEKAKAEAEKTQPAHETTKSNGELPGRFTINSKGAKVCFSRGMLQFNPAKYEFRFAKNQYDIIGKDNEKIAPNYDGWIDLFGWGTSGYMGCQPTETSENYSDYGPAEGDIAGTNYDWGVYNPITNGGNKEGLWRTLTSWEWYYIMRERPNATKLRVRATVCGMKGYMIMPDDFWNNRLRMPLDITADNCSVNQYNAEQWSQLEALGVVFMPGVGERKGKVYDTGWWLIWLSERSDSSKDKARCGKLTTWSEQYTSIGRGVRLIKDVK